MKMRIWHNWHRWWLALPAMLLAFFLLGPIAFLFAQIGKPATLAGWQDPIAFEALRVSVTSASVATVIMVITGVPLGYLLSRWHFPGRQVLSVLLMIPLVFPPVISGILLLSIFGPYGFIGQFFAQIGYELDNAFPGIVLAQIFVGAPFVIVASRAAFDGIDPLLDAVGSTLGAGPLRIFRQIDIPQALPGILAGVALAWLRSLGEYGATVVMSYHPYTLPIYTFVQLSTAGGVAATYPLALEALGASLGIVALVTLIGYIGHTSTQQRFLSEESVINHIEPIALHHIGNATLCADISVTKGHFHLIASIQAQPGITVILGPSGAGKSLLLQALAGILKPDNGSITLGEKTLFRTGTVQISPEQRDVGYVPQGYGLFRHLSVHGNVAFGLQTVAQQQRNELVQDVLGALRIQELAERRPQTLSGGQAQRVALARAIVRHPRMMLLDEPLSAIDPPLRDRLRRELAVLWRRANIPILLVTHDLADARALADTIIIMHNGRVIQVGRRDDVLQKPVSAQAAALVGMRNLVTATVTESWDHGFRLDGPWNLIAQGCEARVGEQMVVAIRSSHIQVALTPHSDWITAIIIERYPVDSGILLRLECDQQELESIVPESLACGMDVGATVWVHVPSSAIWVMREQ